MGWNVGRKFNLRTVHTALGRANIIDGGIKEQSFKFYQLGIVLIGVLHVRHVAEAITSEPAQVYGRSD